MSEEGDRVRERRERLGLDKKELADLAGVHRTTLSAIEEGQGSRRSSLVKIQNALARLEDEAGIDAPPQAADEPEFIEFDVSGEGGFHVVVKGPIKDAALLREQVTAIIREIRKRDAEE